MTNGVVLPENRGRQKSGSRATPHQDLDLCSSICSGGFQASRYFPALSDDLCTRLRARHWQLGDEENGSPCPQEAYCVVGKTGYRINYFPQNGKTVCNTEAV